MDSLLSSFKLPGGVPVGTWTIGRPGRINAAVMAVSILGLNTRTIAGLDEIPERTRRARVLVDGH